MLRPLRRAGRKIPDVAVIGFENSRLARNAQPSLTTVDQPIEEMGAQADGRGGWCRMPDW